MRHLVLPFAAAAALACVAVPASAMPLAPAVATAQSDGYSDDELKRFAGAMARMQTVAAAIQGGTPTDAQQAEMAAAVEDSGLSIERFNAISTAVSGDAVLRARIDVATAEPSAAGSVAASVTDAEAAQFAAAMAEVRSVAADVQNGAPTDEQQAAMAAAVQNSGLDIERFNAISTAVSGDEALQARLALADARRAAGQ